MSHFINQAGHALSLIGMIGVLGALGSAAPAQVTFTTTGTSGTGGQACSTGSFATGSGGTGTFTICYTFNFSNNGCGIFFYDRRFNSIIEGSASELTDSDGESPMHRGKKLIPYTALEYARDLMAAQSVPIEGLENMVIHQCDDPDCDVNERTRRYPRMKAAFLATNAYSEYLKENPEDWAVLREFAIAMMLTNEHQSAMSLMHEAYIQDPGLAEQPVAADLLGPQQRFMRDLVVDAVKWAHRDPSDHAWLLVSVLMQSVDRDDRALEMLERSRDLGLEEVIYEPLKAELD
ncbi:MAG: hypothetical protein AB8C13_09910 [Phycisphaerales bacterium]